MYGYSKHLFDLYAERCGISRHLVGLKYFNVFGPNEWHKGDMRSLVCKSFNTIREKGRVSLFKSHRPDYKDGEQLRDFIYVKDAIDATIHLGLSTTQCGLFNVGSGIASTWIELVTPIFNALGLPVQIDFIDMPEVFRDKYQYYTCADVTKLKSTGWGGCKYSLDAAVTDYVKEYLLPQRYLDTNN